MTTSDEPGKVAAESANRVNGYLNSLMTHNFQTFNPALFLAA
ncbi:MAG: hypothetical protein ACYC3I_18345 [Gemmataceae bacterium]